jgi:hypothetical protein
VVELDFVRYPSSLRALRGVKRSGERRDHFEGEVLVDRYPSGTFVRLCRNSRGGDQKTRFKPLGDRTLVNMVERSSSLLNNVWDRPA